VIDYTLLTMDELLELSKEYLFIICDGRIVAVQRKEEK